MTAGRDSSIVERFEVAGPRELRALFASASADEKRDLRTYLGGERFRRLSLAAAASRGADRNPGMPRSATWTVVVVPDLMGSALEGRRGGEVVQLWPPLPGWHEPPSLEYGLGHSDGAEEPTRATGVLNAYYGELLLRLAGLGHDARAFPYDWRRDVETTAAELDYFLERTCPEHARLALVAARSGGAGGASPMAPPEGPALAGLDHPTGDTELRDGPRRPDARRGRRDLRAPGTCCLEHSREGGRP